ncbi:MAG TPA: leucine-rich repeat domain-containing protein, partial [Candidatus Xenobia bacterium]
VVQLPEWLFRLPNLRRLEIKGHPVTVMPDELGKARTLRHLNLSGNQLVSVPDAIGFLVELEVLNLSGNQLKKVPDTLSRLANLRELYLDHNQIAALPATTGAFRSLSMLDLSINQLTSLPASVEALTELRTLDLTANRLESLPSAVGNLLALRQLRAAGNPLRDLPETVGNLDALELLDVSGSQLRRLPDSLGRLQNLEHLRVAAAALEGLPSSLGGLVCLGELDLSENPLGRLPEEVAHLTSLRHLHLDSTGLTELPAVLSELPDLQTLSLSNNGLTTLPETPPQWPELQSIRLDGNPLEPLSEAWLTLPGIQMGPAASSGPAQPRPAPPAPRAGPARPADKPDSPVPTQPARPAARPTSILAAEPAPVRAPQPAPTQATAPPVSEELPWPDADDAPAAPPAPPPAPAAESLAMPVLSASPVGPIQVAGDESGLGAALTDLVGWLTLQPQDAAASVEGSALERGGEWAAFLRRSSHIIAITGVYGLLQCMLSEPAGSTIAETARLYVAQWPEEMMTMWPVTRREGPPPTWTRTLLMPAPPQAFEFQEDQLFAVTRQHLCIYRISTGALDQTIELPAATQPKLTSPQDVPVLVAAAPGGGFVVAQDRAQTLIWFDLESGETRRLTDLRDVKTMQLLPGGQKVLLQFKGGDKLRLPKGSEGVCLYDLQENRVEREFASDRVVTPLLHPDGHRLLVVTRGQVQVHHLNGEPAEPTFAVGITAMRLLDDHRLAVGTSKGAVEVWNLDTRERLVQAASDARHVTPVVGLAVNRGRGEIVSVAVLHDRAVKVWDGNSGNCIQVLGAADRQQPKYENVSPVVHLSRDGRYLQVQRSKGGFEVYDRTRGDLVDGQVPLTTDGNYAVLVEGTRVRVFTAEGLAASDLSTLTPPPARSDLRAQSHLAMADTVVMSLSETGDCAWADLEHGNAGGTLATQVPSARRLAVSRNGVRLAAAGRFDIVLWELNRPQEPLGRMVEQLTVLDVAIAGDRLYVAVFGGGVYVYDWDFRARQQTLDLQEAEHMVLDPARDRVLTGNDRGITWWKLDGTPVKTLPHVREWTRFSLDETGQFLLGWDTHKTKVHLLDLESGNIDDIALPGGVSAATWYEGNLLWGDAHGLLHVFDRNRRQDVALWIMDAPVAGLAAARGRITVATAGNDLTVLAWTAGQAVAEVPSPAPAPQEAMEVSWAASDTGAPEYQEVTKRPRRASVVTIPLLPDIDD